MEFLLIASLFVAFSLFGRWWRIRTRLSFPPKVEELWDPKRAKRLKELTDDLSAQWSEPSGSPMSPLAPRRARLEEYRAAILLRSVDDALFHYVPAEGLTDLRTPKADYPPWIPRPSRIQGQAMSYGRLGGGPLISPSAFLTRHYELCHEAGCEDVLLERSAIQAIVEESQSQERRHAQALHWLRDQVTKDHKWIAERESQPLDEPGRRLLEARRARMETRKRASEGPMTRDGSSLDETTFG